MDNDVRIGWILPQKVLVIFLCRVKGLERNQLRNNGFLVKAFGGEFFDISGRSGSLLIVHIKNGGAIVGTDVGPLPVQLRRVVDHFEKDVEKLFVRDHIGVKSNLDRLSMFRLTDADKLVIRGLFRSACVT